MKIFSLVIMTNKQYNKEIESARRWGMLHHSDLVVSVPHHIFTEEEIFLIRNKKTIDVIIESLKELRNNTWDKSRVDKIITSFLKVFGKNYEVNW